MRFRYMPDLMLLLKLILVLKALSVYSTHASPLENTAVLNNTKLQYTCHHNITSKAQWSYWPVGKKPREAHIIQSNFLRTSRKTVTKSKDQKQTILTIEPVHPDDAGTYECKIIETVYGKSVALSESKYTANLVVLVSEPVCNSTEKDSPISLQCTIEYRGNLEPVMEWRISNTSNAITDGVTNVHARNQHMSSTLIASRNSHSIHTCTILFKPLETKDVFSASNIPNYSFTWTGPGSTNRTVEFVNMISDQIINKSGGVTFITTVVSSMSFFIAVVTFAALGYYFKIKSSNAPLHVPGQDGTQPVSGQSDTVHRQSETHSNCYEVVGIDGTVYSELNIRGAGACCGPPPRRPQFNTEDNPSYYAPVDHTFRPPTPPPKHY